MVAELLPIDSFRTEPVHLPGLAQLAAGSPITRSASFVMHRQLLRLLALLPRGEVPRAVKECHDQDPCLTDLVLQSILVDEHFPNSWVVQLRYNSPALREGCQPGAGVQCITENLHGRRSRVLCDVLDNSIERVSCGLSPNYVADPSSHLRRSSAATCS